MSSVLSCEIPGIRGVGTAQNMKRGMPVGYPLVLIPGGWQPKANRRDPMKNLLLVIAIAVVSPALLQAQGEPYRVVFDLTSRDTLDQKAVLRWLKEVGTSSPQAEMEVVMYAKGFDLVMPERSSFINEVKESMKNPRVSFRVCAIALKNNNVDKSQLLAGVETVPDGIHEVVMKQQSGWGYIKVVAPR